MVPKGWKEGKVKDLVKSLDAGISVNSEDDGNTNSEFKILKTSCVSNGVFQLEKAKSVVEPNEISRLKEPVKADSIIISRMNTPALVGANGYVENEITNTFLPDRLWQVKPRDNKVNMKWLGYWFSSSHTRYALSSTATGTSGSMKNITKPDVLNIKIDIPPLPEQQKIAKILSTWDKAISTTERLIDNTIQQKKALMQQLLTGKKRLLDDEGERFESEWEEVKLGNICLKVTDGAHHSPQSVEIGYPMYSVKDMTSSGFRKNSARLISKEDFDKLVNQNCKPELNDILIAKDGSILKYCFVVKENIEGVILSSIALLRPNLEKVFPEFIAQYFSQEYVRFFVGKALTSGSGVPRIVLKDFKGIQIALPSIKEQQKIATVLTNADKEIELLEQQLADLQQEKKALMQVLLTGKKRVVVDREVV